MKTTDEKIDLSVVIPLYNEEGNLSPLFHKLGLALRGLPSAWEIIFVDDGSTDGSFRVLERIVSASPQVRVIQLRRNFGKSAALAAGFSLMRGERVVTLDADLQDDPEEIPRLLDLLNEGFDLVSGWRAQRQDRLIKKSTSRLFNLVTSTLTGIKMHDFNCGLKALRREVIKELPLYGELHRYIPVLAYWRGFRVTEMRVTHYPRASGRSKFGVYRFFAGFMDLLTVMFLTKYIKKPLHLFGGAGLVFFLLGLIINFYLAILKLMGQGIGGRPMLILGVLLMLIGFQLISTGLLGEMVGVSIHREREEYIIKKIL